MLHDRITPFMNKIDANEVESVLIVSHENVIEECIFLWLELPIETRRQITFEIAPSSIIHLRVNDWKQKSIVLLNSSDHLLSLISEM